MFLVILTFTPDGRRPGRAAKDLTSANRIAPNGRLPATLPEPIKRARIKDLCGFAGEGNVGEARGVARRTRSPLWT